MRKSLVFVAMSVLACAAMSGCAGTAKGPTDDVLVAKVVADWKAAAEAKDLDKLMDCYCDSYQDSEYGDKAGLREFLQDAIDTGMLDGIAVNTEKAETKIEGDTATVYPIEVKASFGGADIELDLTKGPKGWLVTAMTVEEF